MAVWEFILLSPVSALESLSCAFTEAFLIPGFTRGTLLMRCPRKVIKYLNFELEWSRIINLPCFFHVILYKQLEGNWRRFLLFKTKEGPSILGEVKEKAERSNHLTLKEGGAWEVASCLWWVISAPGVVSVPTVFTPQHFMCFTQLPS